MRWLLAVAAGLALACGSSGDDDAGATTGAGGHGASGGTASAGAGNAGMAGRAGTSGSGGAGAAGAANHDCTGTFGEPVTVLAAPLLGFGSLALRADELELIYTEVPLGESLPSSHFRRSVRTSKDAMFPTGEALTTLDAACGDAPSHTGDLSNDGLRFYFTCYTEVSDAPAAIHLARRASLDAPFVVDATTLGVAQSGLTIDSDELTIVTSPAELGGTLLARRRATTTEPFGSEQELSGLDGLLTPDLSSDGRYLYAATHTDTEHGTLVVAERTGPTAFAPATAIRVFTDPVLTVGSAAISADCRALYYVSVGAGNVESVDVLHR